MTTMEYVPQVLDVAGLSGSTDRACDAGKGRDAVTAPHDAAPRPRGIGGLPRYTGYAFDVHDPLLAAAAWSALAEPGDEVAGALVANLGASEALRWLAQAVEQEEPVVGGGRCDAAESLAEGCATVTGLPDGQAVNPADDSAQAPLAAAHLARGVERWAPRLPGLDPIVDLEAVARCGGLLITPDDPRWPARLRDLGAAAPFALWVRGNGDLDALCRRSVSIVGSRASTAYGEHVTALLAAGVAERGFTVVSGGAYGVDATAHRACIGAEGETVAVMAGGVDRFYPPGNHALLRRVIDCGAVVSESPPGAVAYKARFLSRNRLIAALTSATVVVEAAWRSGALSTARHAAGLMRPVGAVPGPVTSMASGGCHQLLRDGIATCVTDAAEVAELAGTFGGDTLFDAVTDVDGMPVLDSWSMEGLDLTVRRIYDTIPLRGSISVATMTKNAGCSLSETLGALGILEARTLVTPTPQNRWKRTKR